MCLSTGNVLCPRSTRFATCWLRSLKPWARKGNTLSYPSRSLSKRKPTQQKQSRQPVAKQPKHTGKGMAEEAPFCRHFTGNPSEVAKTKQAPKFFAFENKKISEQAKFIFPVFLLIMVAKGKASNDVMVNQDANFWR